MRRLLTASLLAAASPAPWLPGGCASARVIPTEVHKADRRPFEAVRRASTALRQQMTDDEVETLLGRPTIVLDSDKSELHWKYMGLEDERYVGLIVDFHKDRNTWVVHQWHWSL